ncbi:MAG: tetratricopeptide repeat protein, partial [Gemmatimonadota bacterium]
MKRFGRLFLTLAAALLPPVACAQDSNSAQLTSRAKEARHVGRYDEAITLGRQALARDSSNANAARVLIHALSDVGRYDEATTAGEGYRNATHGATDADVLLGDVLRSRGLGQQARAAYERALKGPDSLTARLQLATLAIERGDRDEAMRAFDGFIDVYRVQRARLSADELRAVAVACRYLGRDNPQLYKDALRVYDEAIARDSSNLDTRTELGFLF